MFLNGIHIYNKTKNNIIYILKCTHVMAPHLAAQSGFPCCRGA